MTDRVHVPPTEAELNKWQDKSSDMTLAASRRALERSAREAARLRKWMERIANGKPEFSDALEFNSNQLRAMAKNALAGKEPPK